MIRGLLRFLSLLRGWCVRRWHRLGIVPDVLAGRLRCLGVAPVLMVPLRCPGEGRVDFGDRVVVGYAFGACLGSGEVRLHAGAGAVVSVGSGTHFNNNVQVFAATGVAIGSRCLIGDAVLIMDADGHGLAPERRHDSAGPSSSVVVEDNVWIGSRAIILKGVTLGEGCVVGAGSVVTRTVPPRTVVAGNPARVIRTL